MAALMEYLTQAVQMAASDLFIVPGGAVSIKLDGLLMPIGEEKIMPPQGKELIREIYALAERDMEPFLQTGDDDFSFSVPGLAGDDAEKELTTKPYITVNDPCTGSGALLLGYAGAMKRHKIEYQTKMRAVATDIDLKCVHMAYIQLALYNIPAVIIHGNSLTVEEWSHWFTPALCQAIAAEAGSKQEVIPVTA